MKKRLFSLFMSLIMVISLAAVMPTMTVGAETSGDYEYEILDDGTIEITGYNGSATNLTIPSTIAGKKVTRIGYGAFEYCTNLTSITIPNSVTSIGDDAFRGCSSLTSITIPNGVTSIGESAFWDCSSLTSVTIPNSVTSIGGFAFGGTKWLENKQKENPLVIVNNILIDGSTCKGNVTLPNSVTSIGDSAFEFCSSLKDVYYLGNKKEWNKISIGDGNDCLTSASIHYSNLSSPKNVSNFKASSTSTNSVKLTWNKINDADGYIVYRYNTSTKKYSRIAKGSNLAFTDKNLKAGTTYKYAIRAYKTVNGKEVLSPTYPQITATTNPANITKANFTSSANAVKMSWNKVSGATGYRVYKYNTSTKKWQTVANTKNTSYTFSKLSAGTTYKFTVRAYKTYGGKTYLSPKYSTFITSTNPATVSFKLTAGSKKATVKWSKVTGATGYKVYYKTSKNGSWKCLKTANNKTTSYTKTGLTKGKTYYFTVKAYRTVGGKTYNGSYNTKNVKVK